MISKNFIKSSFIYTLAGALPMASAIILMPFYGRFLTADVFGALSIYFAFALLVQILVAYSFDASLYLNFHEYKKDEKQLSIFISSAFVFILLLSTAVGLLLAVTGNFIFEWVFKDEQISFLPFGILSVATGIFQALFKVNNSLLQTQHKPVDFLWSNVISFGLIASFNILGLYIFPNSLWGPVGGKLLGALISAAWVLSRIFKQFGIHFNWHLLKSTFIFNNSSLIYQVQQWFINYYDRILLLSFLPLASVGYYDLALKCLLAIEFVVAGLNASFFPKVLGQIALQSQKGSSVEINRYYHGLTGVTIVMVCGGILVFPWVIQTFFTKPGYQQAIPLIPLAAIIYLMRPLRLFVAMPYAAVKYSKPLPIFYTFVLVVKIGAMYILVKKFGVYGAIISSLISYGVEILVLYRGVRSRFTFRLNIFKLIVAPLTMGLAIGLLEPLFGATYPAWLHSLYVFIALAVLSWAYWKEIMAIDIFKLIR